MAITLDYDLNPPYGAFEAKPLTDKEEHDLQNFLIWQRDTADDEKRKRRLSGIPLVESQEQTFAFEESIVPKMFRIVRGTHEWDYCGLIPVARAVSERFRHLIEAQEPGVHQFIPFELFDKKGARIDRNYFFWRVRVQLDAVSPALGGVKELGSPPTHGWSIVPGGQDKLAVEKERIMGHAAWIDVRFTNEVFLSDDVVRDLEAQKLAGWRADHVWKEI